MHKNVSRLLPLALGVALVAIAAACNRSEIRDRDSAVGTSGTTSGEGATVTLTGCVQETSGITGDYILTQVNRVDQAVGTSGSTAGGVVAREQRQAAAQSYRLDGDNDQLKNLMGKQVQVKGRITAQADTSLRTRDREKPASSDISTSDLARVKIDAITQVAESCGASK